MIVLCSFMLILPVSAKTIEKDTIKTKSGNLAIGFIGHGSLQFSLNGTVIYIDPWTKLTDYTQLPKADLILITHEHFDHLDTAAISILSKPGTVIMLPGAVRNIIKTGEVLKNGEKKVFRNIGVEAVPAYNTTKDREKFHPKGRDNGYILTIGGKRIYIAGDTENTPEMDKLKHIDIAFLPMNQPYTMTPAQVAQTVKRFHPKILYPYHYGETNVQDLLKLLEGTTATEVRVRNMQ
jgi:L-ascorbate metabolism protein UlaG (beta-lactamase superfamily)